MTKVFLDTNVILDFILKREGFAKNAAIIFDLGERNKIHLTLSSLSINNIDYIVSKIQNKKKARTIVIRLLSITEVLSVKQSTIQSAALSEFKDFEDATQNFCAEEGNVNCIITRNLKDFKKSSLSVQSPTEFLVSFS